MAELRLVLKNSLKTPLEASILSPDSLAGRTLQEIGNLEVWRGNRRVPLNAVFSIEGEAGSNAAETRLTIVGDMTKARRIGWHMTSGTIEIDGNGGLTLGEGMKGGTISVKGSVGSWLGSEMSGGMIEVEGDAEDQVGSSYRGRRSGMSGGRIVIHGNIGSETGCWMTGGTIRVDGSVGLFTGVHMKGGTILVQGDSGVRLGAQMTGGKIVLLGNIPDILPGFMIDDVRASTKVDGEKLAGPFYTFIGDVTENGKGKLFISKEKNPYLKPREVLLW